MPDLLSANRPEFQRDSLTSSGKSELTSELSEGDPNVVRDSTPGAASGGREGVDDIASECAGDMEAGQRVELFERDFVVERGLDAQGAHEHVSDHRAVSHRLHGVGVRRERSSEVCRLFDLAEQQLDEPAEAVGLHDLSCGELASGHGGQVPAHRARRMSDSDESQADGVLALAPNDVQVEERATAPRNLGTPS